MQIPNIPTDNYYKFLATSGVFIALTAIAWGGSKTLDLINDIQNYKTEISILDMENYFLEVDNEYLLKSIDELKKIPPDEIEEFKDTANKISPFEILKSKESREQYEFMKKYETSIFPKNGLRNTIASENRRLLNLNREFAKKVAIITSKQENLNRKNHLLLIFGIIIIFISFIGLKIARYGFKEWYKKVQQPSDEKLAIELEILKQENKDVT